MTQNGERAGAIRIRAYRDTDWADWLRLTRLLFPDEPDEDLVPSKLIFRARPDGEVFVAERPDGTVGGYVEVGERPYADGCASSPVGFIEEWYVDVDLRRAGVGRALLVAAEEWARDRGRTEMGSDALLDNDVSHRAHMHSGYEEVGRVVQFRKPLDAVSPQRPASEPIGG